MPTEEDAQAQAVVSFQGNELLTAPALAAEIKSRIGVTVEPQTVYKWINTGRSAPAYGCNVKLHSIRIGGSIFTSWKAYQKWQSIIDER